MSRQIRSGYQRRILDELVDGPATVSELAVRIGLATSHTSSTLRSLRNAGLVHRDDDHGLRGAAHLLTESGLQRLHEDAMGRLARFLRDGQGEGRHLLLSRDGSTVVIAYDNVPRSDLIWLPARTPIRDQEPSMESSGNGRGAWCLLREAPRWVNRTSLNPVVAPFQNDDPQDILSWSGDERPLAILRGRLLEDAGTWSMAPGTWFDDTSDLAPSRGPAMLSSGTVDLGVIKGTTIRCTPQSPVVGHVRDARKREALLHDTEGVCIARSERPPDAPRRPSSLIGTWIRLRHPRLDEAQVEQRTHHLLQRLTGFATGRMTRLEREVVADFGQSHWTDEPVRLLELARTSETGTTAMWRWALDCSSLPFRGEWTLNQGAHRLLNRVVSDARCEVLVAADARLDDIKPATYLRIDEHQESILCDGRFQVGIEVSERSSRSKFTFWSGDLPDSARALLARDHDASRIQRASRSTKQSDMLRRRALAAWPEGNDALADEWESVDPTSAWIASSTQERERRWDRLQHRLPPAWIELHEVEHASATWLATHAQHGDRAYRAAAALKLADALGDHTEDHGRWTTLSNSVLAAARLLRSAPGQPRAMVDVKQWITDPLHVEAVLPAHWDAVEDALVHHNGTLDKPLAVWSSWRNAGETLTSADLIMDVCANLPIAWWAPWSMTWLMHLGSTARGRRWLSETPMPWVVAWSLREKGEAPGMATVPEANVTAAGLVDLHLVNRGPGFSGVHDLLEALMAREEGRPPPRGQSHIHACWLLWPTEDWPPHVGLVGPRDAVHDEIQRRRVQNRRG